MDAQRSLEDLPVEFEFSYPSADALFGYLVMAISGVVLAIAVFIIIFGPSDIMVSMVRGPTFTQFWQLYPGPIATGAGVVFSLGNYLLTQHKTSEKAARCSHVESLLLPSIELPKDYQLLLTALGRDRYRLEIEKCPVTSQDDTTPEGSAVEPTGENIIAVGQNGIPMRLASLSL